MKLIIPALIAMLAFPAQSMADPPAPEIDETPKVTGINKGEEAPYTGVLLNTAAAAKIFADKDFSAQECIMRINFEVQKEHLRMQLLLDNTKLSLDTMDKKYTAIIDIKNNEIERLSKVALENSNDYSTWWAVGGVLAGIALTIAVVYAVEEVK
jgi:hypothetical protein